MSDSFLLVVYDRIALLFQKILSDNILPLLNDNRKPSIRLKFSTFHLKKWFKKKSNFNREKVEGPSRGKRHGKLVEPPSLKSLKNVIFQTMKGEIANHFYSQSRILSGQNSWCSTIVYTKQPNQTEENAQTQICNNLSSAFFSYLPSWPVRQYWMSLKYSNIVVSLMWRWYKMLILDFCVCSYVYMKITYK